MIRFIRSFFTRRQQQTKPLSEPDIRKMFKVMHHPDSSTRKLVESRRLGR